MKRRILAAVTAAAMGGGAYLLVWGGTANSHEAASLPSACVVVAGPNGLNVQVGYAPTGPGACENL